MEIIIIAAVGKQRQLGLQGNIPWRVSSDFKHFKQQTTGHAILMGRKTFCGEGIQKPLPNRRNIVVSSSLQKTEGVEIVRSFTEGIALAKAHKEGKLFICGGSRIYEEGLLYADRMLLSEINFSGEADTFFPKFDLTQWTEIKRSSYPSENSQPSWELVEYCKQK